MRNNKAFLIGIVIFVAAIIGLAFMGTLLRVNNSGKSIEPEFAKGQIILGFKDEVGKKEALTLLEKYKLAAPENFFKHDYVPIYSLDDNLEYYAGELRKLSFVKSVNVVGKDRGDLKPWIAVDFVRAIGRDEISVFLKPYGQKLYVEKGFYSLAIQTVQVPAGKESYYIEQLQLEPIVKYVSLNNIAHIN